MPVDKYQKIIDRGNATIYLTLRIKFRSKKRLPANPHPREIAFRMISLKSQISDIHEWVFSESSHHCGSGMPTPFSSAPNGNRPSSGRSALHFVTRAEIDSTFAKGPIVAAMRGNAVDATHQSLSDYGLVHKTK